MKILTTATLLATLGASVALAQQATINSKYVENDPYMGAPVELVEAPNGAEGVQY